MHTIHIVALHAACFKHGGGSCVSLTSHGCTSISVHGGISREVGTGYPVGELLGHFVLSVLRQSTHPEEAVMQSDRHKGLVNDSSGRPDDRPSSRDDGEETMAIRCHATRM